MPTAKDLDGVTVTFIVPVDVHENLLKLVLSRGEDKSSFLRKILYKELKKVGKLPKKYEAEVENGNC